ncbi:MAG TPA: DUF1579 domain-containing protein [Burkholderiaceae bacterium]
MKTLIAGLICTFTIACASAQRFDDSAQRMAAQRTAMQSLAMIDGVWRGPAVTTLPDGKKFELTQTERVGPFLEGAVKVIEGRGYGPDGKTVFNAFGTISYEPSTQKYTLHSHAQSHAGAFPLKATGEGFMWEMPAGPMTMRFTTTIKDGTWTEIGERIMPGGQVVRFFEMKLKRVGDTSWPAGDAVNPK